MSHRRLTVASVFVQGPQSVREGQGEQCPYSPSAYMLVEEWAKDPVPLVFSI